MHGVTAADIQVESIEWIWEGVIPLGMTSIFYGDPGTNKSTVTLDLAARVSAGTPMPMHDDPSIAPSLVGIISGEDAAECTIVPRLMLARANLKNIKIYSDIRRVKDGKVQTQYIDLADLDAFDKLLTKAEGRMKLLIIDPISAYMPSTDSHNDAQVRSQIMTPLTMLARKHRVAILLVMHMNKNQQTSNPLYRAGGSIGIPGAARSVWMVVKDQSDPMSRLLLPSKVANGQSTYGYKYGIKVNEVVKTNHPYVCWSQDTVPHSAETYFQSLGERDSKTDTAAKWLQQKLGSKSLGQRALVAMAHKDGISPRTLRRAKEVLGIKSIKKGGEWVWSHDTEREYVPPAENINDDAPF